MRTTPRRFGHDSSLLGYSLGTRLASIEGLSPLNQPVLAGVDVNFFFFFVRTTHLGQAQGDIFCLDQCLHDTRNKACSQLVFRGTAT